MLDLAGTFPGIKQLARMNEKCLRNLESVDCCPSVTVINRNERCKTPSSYKGVIYFRSERVSERIDLLHLL